MILRFDAWPYHANVSFLEERLISEVTQRPGLEYVFIGRRGLHPD